MKKITLTSLLLAMLFVLGGCETMKGLGSDIQKAGAAIEKKASE